MYIYIYLRPKKINRRVTDRPTDPKKKRKKIPDLPNLILKTMQSETHIFLFWPKEIYDSVKKISKKWYKSNQKVIMITGSKSMQLI